MLAGAAAEGLFVDATLGGGGHAALLLQMLPNARLIGIDRDQEAIRAAKARLAPFGERFTAIHGNFHDIASILPEKVDGILMDLGVSSYQLDHAERGFSFHDEAPLDMRMDQGEALDAHTVVNEYDEKTISRILREYGEERFAGRIARNILRNRPIRTTLELADIITEAIPAATRRTGGHPARRSFQAIRIEVNNELGGLQTALEDAVSLLRKDGRICVITFHSLEDRIVKHTFARLANPCVCPPKAPLCTCGAVASLSLINRKPITADEEELERNPRARSAKLRGAKKIID